jgi:hypothetical protein
MILQFFMDGNLKKRFLNKKESVEANSVTAVTGHNTII